MLSAFALSGFCSELCTHLSQINMHNTGGSLDRRPRMYAPPSLGIINWSRAFAQEEQPRKGRGPHDDMTTARMARRTSKPRMSQAAAAIKAESDLGAVRMGLSQLGKPACVGIPQVFDISTCAMVRAYCTCGCVVVAISFE